MTYALAVACLASLAYAGQEGTTGGGHHTANVTAQTLTPPPAVPSPAPDQPKITKAEFERVFGAEPTSPKYEQYTSMKPEERADFERQFKANAPKNAQDTAAATWARDWRSKFTQVSAIRTEVNNTDPDKVFDNAEAQGGVGGPVQNEGPVAGQNPRRDRPTPTPTPANEKGLATGEVPKPGTVEDKAPEAKEGPVVDEKFRSLLKNATLGALAGAAVGIGLLPLFGPIGILIGAAMGASLMVVTKKLSG